MEWAIYSICLLGFMFMIVLGCTKGLKYSDFYSISKRCIKCLFFFWGGGGRAGLGGSFFLILRNEWYKKKKKIQ